MKKEAKKALQDIVEQIDKASEPTKMSKSEAVDWLEELNIAIEERLDCLHDEMKETPC